MDHGHDFNENDMTTQRGERQSIQTQTRHTVEHRNTGPGTTGPGQGTAAAITHAPSEVVEVQGRAAYVAIGPQLQTFITLHNGQISSHRPRLADSGDEIESRHEHVVEHILGSAIKFHRLHTRQRRAPHAHRTNFAAVG
jgi:hypothetical protein